MSHIFDEKAVIGKFYLFLKIVIALIAFIITCYDYAALLLLV